MPNSMYCFLSLVLVVGCALRSESSQSASGENEISLKDRAGSSGLIVGTAVKSEPFQHDQAYLQKIAYHYHTITPENALKMDTTHPAKEQFDFTIADQMLNFATEKDLKVHGHTLVWYSQVPEWLTNSDFTSTELKDVLIQYIKSVVGHFRDNYPGRITYWDVVNEAVCEQGESGCNADRVRPSVWNKIGPNPWDYIPIAFKAAREADPDVKLLYNDYNLVWGGGKSEKVYQLVKSLVDNNVPIDGVGFQMHVGATTSDGTPALFNPAELKSQMLRYQQLGLEVQITEMDVRIKVDDGTSDVELDAQAKNYRNALRVCLDVPACKMFTTWGFTDRYSWIPDAFKGHGKALPFDYDMKPKPAFRSMIDLFVD